MQFGRVHAAARAFAFISAFAISSGMSSSAIAEILDPDAAVSSDGSVATNGAPYRGDMSPSFEGSAGSKTLAPLSADAIRATGARPATEEDHRRFRDAKPIRPSGSPFESGGIPAESVIGPDGRKRVTKTTAYPTRATVIIVFGGGNLCSGWLIGPDTVATAGHCVAEGGSGQMFAASSYQIAPGYNRNKAPYGVCGARFLVTNKTWFNKGRDDYDYAVIKLDCTIGNTVGWYGLSKSVATGSAVTVQGYPGDKKFGTHWKMSGSVLALQTRRVFYGIDTAGGQSGAPVWRKLSNCRACGVAIHAYGVSNQWPVNHGTRITGSVMKFLVSWKNAN